MNMGVAMWKLKRIRRALQKLLTKRSVFPHSAFRIPTFLILIQVFAPAAQLVANTENQNSGILSASVDQNAVPVGGIIWLTLDYRLPEGGQLPEKLEIKGLEGLSILKHIVNPQQIRIQLLVDHVGPWQSAPISLSYLDANGETQRLTSKPVAIQVVSNIDEKKQEAELRPIRDIVSVKSIWQSYLLWMVVFVFLMLIGLGLFWWYKRRRTPATITEYTEPPDVRARRELRGLESQRFFENGLVKKYYFIYSEILRRYLESIRNFPAAEYTTEEIAKRISSEPDRKLIVLLQQADLVKFADKVPTPAGKEKDIKSALAYIRQTSPQPKTVVEQMQQQEELK